jgi:hypothetical protein
MEVSLAPRDALATRGGRRGSTKPVPFHDRGGDSHRILIILASSTGGPRRHAADAV